MKNCEKNNINIIKILNENAVIENIQKSIERISDEFAEITGIIPTSNGVKDTTETMTRGGIALSPDFAATCMGDIFRTTKFLRAVYQAINDKIKEKGEARIIYPGSGPYGTLVTPLLKLFPEDKVKVNFIDINKRSTDALKEVITKLGLEKYTDEINTCDAFDYQTEKRYDILIIECTQAALSKEPQVSLTEKFVNYLVEDGIIIPEEINLKVMVSSMPDEINYIAKESTNIYEVWKKNRALKRRVELGFLLELNKNSAKALFKNKNLSKDNFNRYYMVGEITIPKLRKVSDLCYLSEIRLYKDIYLNDWESGLTYPMYDKEAGIVQAGNKYEIYYSIGEITRFWAKKI